MRPEDEDDAEAALGLTAEKRTVETLKTVSGAVLGRLTREDASLLCLNLLAEGGGTGERGGGGEIVKIPLLYDEVRRALSFLLDLDLDLGNAPDRSVVFGDAAPP